MHASEMWHNGIWLRTLQLMQHLLFSYISSMEISTKKLTISLSSWGITAHKLPNILTVYLVVHWKMKDVWYNTLIWLTCLWNQSWYRFCWPNRTRDVRKLSLFSMSGVRRLEKYRRDVFIGRICLTPASQLSYWALKSTTTASWHISTAKTFHN